MSIDQKDAEIQQLFTTMKKTQNISQKQTSAQILAKMYEKDDEECSVGILKRIYKFISDSQDKQEKRVGLITLAEVGLKMQGSARSAFVNKFHSPVFKLFQTNQDQFLIEWMEKAYKTVLELGGNQNDAAVEANFFTSISFLEGNVKDIKKMGAYSALVAIVEQSPYLAFKKLPQKHKQYNIDNLQILINASKTKNIKIRQYYIKFLQEYISYIGQKKDNNFKIQTLNRFLFSQTCKQNSEGSIHLTIQTLRICLIHLNTIITQAILDQKINFALDKIRNNKSIFQVIADIIIEKSLIQVIPLLVSKSSTKSVVDQVLNYLRGIEGEDQVIAQIAINEVLNKIKDAFVENEEILKLIVDEMDEKFKKIIVGKIQSNANNQLISSKVTTILILLREGNITDRIFDRQKLDEITSNAMMLVLNDKTIELISEISKKNIFDLGALLQKKLITLISKTLTGSGKKIVNSKEMKPFLEKLEKLSFLESDQNKIRAIQSLSFFKFREDFQNFVGKFVKQKALKKYLECRSSEMREATAQAAFNLYVNAKKNTTIAQNQMMQILYKLLCIGMTDEEQSVRIKVYSTLQQKVSHLQSFQNYFVNSDILTHIFQATLDRNQKIRFISLKIITLLHSKKPSAQVIPFLKKLTYNIMTNLSTNFKFNHQKQYHIKSLSIIIENAPSIIENHVQILLESLLGYLTDRKNYEGLELVFFSTFQVLIEHHPLKVIPYLANICKHIVQALNDKLNSKKREKSLKLLLSMIKKCGYVVIPYFQVPCLIQSLTYLLRSEISKQSRIDLLRVIGGFGAIDRYKFYKIDQLIKNIHEDQKTEVLSMKGYNFKFLLRKKQLIHQRKFKGENNELKQYYDDILLLDNNYNDPNYTKSKSTLRNLVTKYVITSPQNKDIQSPIQTQLLRERVDPYNFNIVIIINLFLIMNDTLTYDVMFRIFEILGKNLEKDLHIIIPLLVSSQMQIIKLLICIVKDCDVTLYLNDIINYSLNRCTDVEHMTECLEIIAFEYRVHLRSNLDAIIGKLYTLIQERSDDHKLQVKIVMFFRNLRELMQPYLQEIITILFDKYFKKISEVTNTILDFLMSLANYCQQSLPQFFSKISSNLSQILINNCHKGHIECKPCLRIKIGNCVAFFLITFGKNFMIYLPEIHKAIVKCQQIHEFYMKAIHYMENCYYGNLRDQFSEEELEKLIPEMKRPYLNWYEKPKYTRKIEGIEGTEELIHEFDTSGKKFSDSDWIQWLRKISILLLRRSPNTLLRTCADLAEEYSGLALEFFNISFFFLWEILLDAQKKQLIDNLKKIIESEPKPYISISKTILNMVQFMNRKKVPLQINSTLLAQCAKQSSAHSKSLYYKQLQFEENPQQSIEELIQIYMLLGQPENATGLLKIAKNMGIECKVEWYEKLGYYEQAYKLYLQRQKMVEKNEKQLIQAKKLKCLKYFNSEQFFDEISQFQKKYGKNSQLALIACKSFAELGEWNKVKKWQTYIPENQHSSQKAIIRGLVNIKQGDYAQALECISESRIKIYNEVSDFIVFSSSSNSFDKIIKIQQLFQMQEIIELKKMQKQLKNYSIKQNQNQQRYTFLKNEYSKNIQKIKQVWSDRLLGFPKTQEIWTKFANLRSLLFTNMQYFQFFYEYCEICIKNGKVMKCQEIIHQFKKQIELNRTKYEDRLEMIEVLDIQVNFAQDLIKTEQQINMIAQFLSNSKNLPAFKKSQLLFECANVLIGESQVKWQKKIIGLLEDSTKLYDFEKQLQVLGNMHLTVSQQDAQHKTQHIRQALRVFIKLLTTSQTDNEYHLQSCLKVLGILFKYSQMTLISQQFLNHYKEVPLEVWINVTPQMIAHLYESDHHFCLTRIIKEILIYIGQVHPESILYSLIFAARSKIPERIRPAEETIEKIRIKYPALTEEIWTISKQLSKAAIKLKQFWYDGIESAWGIYNQSKSTSEVLALLKDLKQEVMSRKKTNSEIAFHHEYSQQIEQGFQWLQRFQSSDNVICLSQAFQLFIGVYRRVKESFQNLKKVYLKNVAPSLVLSHRYLSAIPGMYNIRGKNIKISSFYNELTVLQSKQRPRKLKIFGDDEKQYHFLLKGREDVRLDERVMQFLGLVNKLLERQNQIIKKDLNITRYQIIPLTVNTGLIGWVEGCDTLNQLIKDYRIQNKLRVYLERENYQKICPQYAYLPMINKLQVFLTVLESGQGKDLLRIFWYNSENSEQWVERRRNYTTSLATMSMVGYILGLGDRHPSNIMIKKKSGKVVHIDFGDCFQVAALRQKFPEKVPFRLTRMLQNAMGAAGIHGLYHQTCQDVMKVLRDNKDSLLGVLQTFIHDPILSWRIIVGKKDNEQAPMQKENNLNMDGNKKLGNEMIGSIMQGLEYAIVQVHKQDEVPGLKQKFKRTRESEKINEKAIHALVRIKQKFVGADWGEKELTIKEQVSRLIREAISHENICQSWPGWCPYW